jgi:hypothetical protein
LQGVDGLLLVAINGAPLNVTDDVQATLLDVVSELDQGATRSGPIDEKQNLRTPESLKKSSQARSIINDNDCRSIYESARA